jgi:hypothetical protein
VSFFYAFQTFGYNPGKRYKSKTGFNLRFLLCMKALSLLAGEAADYGVLSEGKKILVIERQQELNLKIGGEHKNEIT